MLNNYIVITCQHTSKVAKKNSRSRKSSQIHVISEVEICQSFLETWLHVNNRVFWFMSDRHFPHKDA